MGETLAKLRLWKRFFGWLSLLSFAVLLVFSGSAVNVRFITFPQEPLNKLTLWISIASLVTSAVSLLVFFLTTILAWRKERREAKNSELDNRKKELEIEKLKAELDEMKQGGAHPELKSESVITYARHKRQRIKR